MVIPLYFDNEKQALRRASLTIGDDVHRARFSYDDLLLVI